MIKPILSILVILLLFFHANATNYYLSSTSGNDLQNDGKTIDTPWQSIDKLKTVSNLLLPGDSIFFKCNDSFKGQLILTRSGNATKNIYFGSYGSGKKPVISGTAMVSNWVQTSTNVWEATCNACGTKVTNLFINGIPQQIGRWPNVTDENKGYLSYELHAGTNQITDQQLTDAINWTGAEAVVRRVRWILDRMTIKSHIGNTLLFTTSVNYEFSNGYGYFIQNDPRTLDLQGEWYYNPTTKKFILYSETDPNTYIINATQYDNILRMNGLSYITIEGIKFTGSVRLTMDIDRCNKLTIRNNEIDYSGENGVDINTSNNVVFESNLINHTNNNAFVQAGCRNFVMTNNIIKNTALIAGMGLGSDGQYNAVQMAGTNVLFEHNLIDSVGYIGMNFNGDTVTIKNNIISNYCITKDDGGGLYTWSSGTKNYSRKLIGNILLNAVGAAEGAVGNVAAEGIYIDDRSSNVDIIGNSIYKCGNNGIYIHNADHVTMKGNNVYDNGVQLVMRHDNIAPTFPIINCVVDGNVFVARESNQLVASFETIDNKFTEMGTFQDNSYCRPFDDNLTIYARYINGTAMTLDSWRTTYQKDQTSTKSPIEVNEYKVLGVTSSNYFLNPDFETSTSNWLSWSKYNNSRTIVAKEEGNPGNVLKISFISPSGKADAHMIVSSNRVQLIKGKSYRLKFSVKSSLPDVTLKMIPRKNTDPYNEIADKKMFIPGTTYKDFEFLIFPNMDELNSRIDFEIPEFHGSIWLDNLELVEVDIDKTNPDEYIRFEYNASKDMKIINIPDNYVDSKGKSVSGSISLKPYTSVIIFKKLTTSIGDLLQNTMKSDILLMPNPTTDFVTVKSQENILSVFMHDLNGRKIKSFIGLNTKELTINDLPASGIYLMDIYTTGKRESQKLFIQN